MFQSGKNLVTFWLQWKVFNLTFQPFMTAKRETNVLCYNRQRLQLTKTIFHFNICKQRIRFLAFLWDFMLNRNAIFFMIHHSWKKEIEFLCRGIVETICSHCKEMNPANSSTFKIVLLEWGLSKNSLSRCHPLTPFSISNCEVSAISETGKLSSFRFMQISEAQTTSVQLPTWF